MREDRDPERKKERPMRAPRRWGRCRKRQTFRKEKYSDMLREAEIH